MQTREMVNEYIKSFRIKKFIGQYDEKSGPPLFGTPLFGVFLTHGGKIYTVSASQNVERLSSEDFSTKTKDIVVGDGFLASLRDNNQVQLKGLPSRTPHALSTLIGNSQTSLVCPHLIERIYLSNTGDLVIATQAGLYYGVERDASFGTLNVPKLTVIEDINKTFAGPCQVATDANSNEWYFTHNQVCVTQPQFNHSPAVPTRVDFPKTRVIADLQKLLQYYTNVGFKSFDAIVIDREVLAELASENDIHSEACYKGYLTKLKLISFIYGAPQNLQAEFSLLEKCKNFTVRDIKQALSTHMPVDLICLVKYNDRLGKISYDLCLDSILRGSLRLTATVFTEMSESPHFNEYVFMTILTTLPATRLATFVDTDTALGQLSYRLLMSETVRPLSGPQELDERAQIYCALRKSPLAKDRSPESYLQTTLDTSCSVMRRDLNSFEYTAEENKDSFGYILHKLLSILLCFKRQYTNNKINPNELKDFINLITRLSTKDIPNFATLEDYIDRTHTLFMTNPNAFFSNTFNTHTDYGQYRFGLKIHWIKSKNFDEVSLACKDFITALTQSKSNDPTVKYLQKILLADQREKIIAQRKQEEIAQKLESAMPKGEGTEMNQFRI